MVRALFLSYDLHHRHSHKLWIQPSRSTSSIYEVGRNWDFCAGRICHSGRGSTSIQSTRRFSTAICAFHQDSLGGTPKPNLNDCRLNVVPRLSTLSTCRNTSYLYVFNGGGSVRRARSPNSRTTSAYFGVERRNEGHRCCACLFSRGSTTGCR